MRHSKIKTSVYDHKLKDEYKGLSGLSFVVISDFHNNDYNVDIEKILGAIHACNPAFVIFAGDIVTARRGHDNTAAFDFMRRVSSEYRVYYGVGNHENRLGLPHYHYGDMHSVMMENICRNENIEYLDNRKAEFVYNGIPVHITGLTISDMYYNKKLFLKRDSVDVKSVIGDKCSGFNILLAHNPKYFDSYAAWEPDLIFAGHYHGGIMRLPVLGGVISPELRLFPKYDYGMYDMGKSTMIVSSGLGAHTIPMRIFNRVEIVKVKLI